MKKLTIVLACFLLVAGGISISWAHGSKGGGSGFRGHGHSRPHFSRPSYPGIHLRHNQHINHKSHRSRHYHQKSHKRQNRLYRQKGHHRHKAHNKYKGHHRHKGHLRHKGHHKHKGHHRHYRHKGHHRYYWPYYGPYARIYGYEDGPPLDESPQGPQHTLSSEIYYNKNPDPWFLYGKGNELRQMGVIPPLP